MSGARGSWLLTVVAALLAAAMVTGARAQEPVPAPQVAPDEQLVAAATSAPLSREALASLTDQQLRGLIGALSGTTAVQGVDNRTTLLRERARRRRSAMGLRGDGKQRRRRGFTPPPPEREVAYNGPSTNDGPVDGAVANLTDFFVFNGDADGAERAVIDPATGKPLTEEQQKDPWASFQAGLTNATSGEGTAMRLQAAKP